MRNFLYMLSFALTLTLFLPAGMAAQKDKEKGKPPDIVFVAEDDKEMNAAMEKSRKSVEDFVKAFQNRQKGQSHFGVKVAIRDGKKVEHFWVEVIRLKGTEFVGTINNDPMLVKTVEAGDKVTVDKGKISDWMYVEKQKLVGGYTVRVLRNRLTPEQRKALDESIPYKIE